MLSPVHTYRGGAWRYLSPWVCTATLSSEELDPSLFLHCIILLCTLRQIPSSIAIPVQPGMSNYQHIEENSSSKLETAELAAVFEADTRIMNSRQKRHYPLARLNTHTRPTP
jgi:hypothetical protein